MSAAELFEDARRRETPALVELVLERFHAVHGQDFHEAQSLAEAVELQHSTHEACPMGLVDLLTLMADELEDHQQKEEAVLFPLMLAGGHPMISGPIQRMLMDHDDLQDQLADMVRLTQSFQAPVGACSTWRRLYETCAKLHADLSLHMKIENELLFPRFTQERAA